MSRLLILVRHAKAEEDNGSDRDRVLTSIGRGQAEAVGSTLVSEGVVPDHVICSAAARTRQTLELAMASLPKRPTVDFEEAAYGADPETILDLVHMVDPEVGTLMVVGHNPTMAQLAALFTGSGSLTSFPTAGIAIVELDVDWLYAEPGTGTGRILT
ncbi:phosphohistidine phosphatase [Lipingzhangella halophila]|uniref:Phosphohistidine phosphatase n=1 Tax=Lipingzhangella halophila TaxID=1783352 RepID=A0A7W7W5D6_9ACTN|nr:histidine phosphatase family protein [Lipingzhangella halophila]MBB4934681.1 phosphohistidine phosphatase [Lipingzhangella halophila]